ncbi:putative phage holin [Sphaerisporangium aureirubrum]|uniref:DUF2809 domain-containing protein n=1 Tax=Sphaerisporangium aureirubrum TaxID=1544736 RepID=A0ABW1ND73_9ACTN
MADAVYLIGTVLVIISAVLADGCVAAQMLLARWWLTPQGRHVFVFQGALALTLDLWGLRALTSPRAAAPPVDWFLIARTAAFALIPIALGWRLIIIIRTWRTGRRNRKESG